MKKLLYGVGHNNADYVVEPWINGKKQPCPYYRTWARIFARCYSIPTQRNSPYYKGCTVDERWHYFMDFKQWCIDQGMTSPDHFKNMQLDKDIIFPGNKHYGPDTCVFVSSSLNKLLTHKKKSRGSCPVGVSFYNHHKKFVAEINYNNTRKKIGYFNDPHTAYLAYKEFKLKAIQDQIDTHHDLRIKQGLERHKQLLIDDTTGY
jgi:hypothetical protein